MSAARHPFAARRLATGLLAVVIASLGAEGFLRLMMPSVIMYGTWFTPGINEPDDDFGFVYTPHYEGFMRHRDHVPDVPLALDGDGFRLAAEPREPSGSARRVDIIGGASVMMCYGLPDRQTIAWRLRDASAHDLHVRNTAWPGFDTLRGHRLWQRVVEREDRAPDLVVIAVYGADPDDWMRIPEPLSTLPTPPPRDELFRFHPTIVLRPKGVLADRLGPWFYRSFFLHRLVTTLDELPLSWLRRVRRDTVGSPADPATPAREREVVARERFAALMELIRSDLDARGCRMLVVFLPQRGEAPDQYASLRSALPPGMPAIDVHEELAPSLHPDGFIASGHYDAALADEVARRIATHVDEVLGPVDTIRTR